MKDKVKNNIKSTNWLTKGMTQEEIKRIKEEALREADRELAQIKEREKQIEEMILDMFDYSRTLVNIKTATEDSNFINRYKEALKGYATFLVNRNYRKLQEDDVVVPKDEYRYIKDMADRFDPFWFCAFGGCEGACKECKDTCEMSIFVKERKKFYDKFNENICTFKLENKSQEYTDGYTQAIADICGRLDKTAVELGVNVKE